MGWQIRVAQHALLSRLPFQQELRRFKRHIFGNHPIEENLQHTLFDFESIETEISALGRCFNGTTVLEIGSGWFPILPLMAARSGAKKVYLTDLAPYLDEVSFSETIKFLSKRLPDWTRAERTNFSDFPFEYLAPFKISAVPDGSVDFVLSRTVLEHVPTADLPSLLASFAPKLSPRGLMIHLVDHSDHLEHDDKSISKINFLTWSARKHGFITWLNNGGENRLRHHEFPQIFRQSGYEVVKTNTELHPATFSLAPTLSLAPPYSSMSAEQVSILRSIYVLKPNVLKPNQLEKGSLVAYSAVN